MSSSQKSISVELFIELDRTSFAGLVSVSSSLKGISPLSQLLPYLFLSEEVVSGQGICG